MKRLALYILFIFALCCQQIKGQHSDSAQVLNNSWAFRIGKTSLFDQSLSPQEYSGLGYSWTATHGMYYPNTQYRVSWELYDTWQYASLLNSSQSAMITLFDVKVGFGSYYHWRPVKNLTLQAGAIMEVYGAVKMQSRNVNNIGAGDIALTLAAAGKARYDIPTKPVIISFQYAVSTPIAGAMFIPEWGQSYFEIYEHLIQSLPDVIKFSSFHNKYGVNGKFNIDLIFKGFTLRTGFAHNNMYWTGNNLAFYHNDIYGEIGTVVDLQLLCGQKALKRTPILY